MIIPKSFFIAGKRYRVKWDHANRLAERNLIGEVDYAECTVVLADNDKGSRLTRPCLEQVYLHEVWHAIWGALGNDRLQKDENLADAFTELLLQVLNSGKGELH